MKNHREFMQALISGKTLIDVNDVKIKLNKDGMVGDMNGWLTPDGVGNYKWFEIYTVMDTPETFAALSGHKLFDPATDVDPVMPANLGATQATDIEKYKKEKTYLTSPDSKLRPLLDGIAKFIDKVKGI